MSLNQMMVLGGETILRIIPKLTIRKSKNRKKKKKSTKTDGEVYFVDDSGHSKSKKGAKRRTKSNGSVLSWGLTMVAVKLGCMMSSPTSGGDVCRITTAVFPSGLFVEMCYASRRHASPVRAKRWPARARCRTTVDPTRHSGSRVRRRAPLAARVA